MTVSLLILPHGTGLPPPARATPGSAGFDLHAAVAGPVVLAPGERAVIPCGFAMALPEGWEAQIRPRSGLAVRHGITVLNAPGTIDADYRGEVQVPLVNLGQAPYTVERGERIAQMVFARFEAPTLEAASALPPTARGDAGFGSTGRR